MDGWMDGGTYDWREAARKMGRNKSIEKGKEEGQELLHVCK